jgi:peroxiredoxin
LADFQSHYDELLAEGVKVIAASSDPLNDALKAVDELGIKYPLAYNLDAEAVSKIIGSYYETYKEAKPVEHTAQEEDEITGDHAETTKKFIQPTGIILRPDHTIDVICYSSGHVGRLTAEDVLELVRYYHRKES